MENERKYDVLFWPVSDWCLCNMVANYLYSISHFLLYFLDKYTFLLRIWPGNHNLCHLRILVKVLKEWKHLHVNTFSLLSQNVSDSFFFHGYLCFTDCKSFKTCMFLPHLSIVAKTFNHLSISTVRGTRCCLNVATIPIGLTWVVVKCQFQTFEIDKFLDFSFLDVFASSRKKRCLRAKFLISYSKTIKKKTKRQQFCMDCSLED